VTVPHLLHARATGEQFAPVHDAATCCHMLPHAATLIINENLKLIFFKKI
jgi:hypothetical protein